MATLTWMLVVLMCPSIFATKTLSSKSATCAWTIPPASTDRDVLSGSLIPGTLIESPGMISEVMEELGQFPLQYYIRHEAKILFDLIEEFFEIPEKGGGSRS